MKLSFKERVIRRILPRGIYTLYKMFYFNVKAKNYSKIGGHVDLVAPLTLDTNAVELEPFSRLQNGVNIISAHPQRLVVKKYAAVGAECIIYPGTHVPTVGIPQYLSTMHINDVNNEVVIPEDSWIGTRCIIMSKAKLGRGCIVGAGSFVNKTYPPYAVLAGSPAKVIAVRFTIDQILEHERQLYPAEERFSREYLEQLFEENFKDLRTIGTDKMSAEDRERLSKRKAELGMYDGYTNKDIQE